MCRSFVFFFSSFIRIYFYRMDIEHMLDVDIGTIAPHTHTHSPKMNAE